MLLCGDRIKEYEVITPLRSGGMGMLYLARRRGVGGFSRLVALKLVQSHLADDASINRLFLHEARITASVAHPNVVNVEEVGEADGYYFMAMEYVHGVSLAELLGSLHRQKLRMSSKLCVWVAAHVAEALHAAHEATGEDGAPLHIVHRDVSPQNILIGHNGHIKLIDFGIAKSYPLSRHATGGSAVLGKLGYMAPEQLGAGPVDRRTDVYALGVMVWEMLTARGLFRCIRIDDEQDWLTRESPPAPSRYCSSVTTALDRAVCRAIAFAPTGRYDDALAFRAALLQADPAAAEVDAPRFAELMRTMLGDELERRRASWPSEVSVELDIDAEKTRGPGLNIEELTVKLRSSEAPDAPDDDECDEPTMVRESPLAPCIELRGKKSSELRFARSAEQAAAPSAASPTPVLGVPASRLQSAAARNFGARAPRAFALCAWCVGLATMLATPAPTSRPRTRLEVGMVFSSPQLEARGLAREQDIEAREPAPDRDMDVDGRPALAERANPAPWLLADRGRPAACSILLEAEETAWVASELADGAALTTATPDVAAKENHAAPRAKRIAKPSASHGKGKRSGGAKSKSRWFSRSST